MELEIIEINLFCVLYLIWNVEKIVWDIRIFSESVILPLKMCLPHWVQIVYVGSRFRERQFFHTEVTEGVGRRMKYCCIESL